MTTNASENLKFCQNFFVLFLKTSYLTNEPVMLGRPQVELEFCSQYFWEVIGEPIFCGKFLQ